MFYGPGDLRLEDIAVEHPGPGEIAVDIKAAATCGTDLKSYRRGHPTLFPTLPARFGHEFSGIVSEVGEGVADFMKEAGLLRNPVEVSQAHVSLD